MVENVEGAENSAGVAGVDPLRSTGTLMRLVRVLEQGLRSGGEAEPLTITDLSVLGQIDRGINLPSQVARALHLDPARVTHISDRLVAQGSMVRQIDPGDRRRWRLVLTEDGMRRLEEGRATLRTALTALFSQLSQDDRAALQGGLEAMRQVLDTQL